LATFSGIALSVIAAATLHLALEKPAQTFGRQLSQAIARETAWRT
jgi:peptidoglycan/LPS O-acetylase OafA/YrhL